MFIITVTWDTPTTAITTMATITGVRLSTTTTIAMSITAERTPAIAIGMAITGVRNVPGVLDRGITRAGFTTTGIEPARIDIKGAAQAIGWRPAAARIASIIAVALVPPFAIAFP